MKQGCLAIILLSLASLACAAASRPHKPVQKCSCAPAGQQAPEANQRGTDSSPLSVKLLNTGESAKEATEKSDYISDAKRSGEWTIWLTAGLVCATILQFGALIWQGRQIKGQITLARAEFIATHRPRFVIREPYLAVIHCPADPPAQVAHQVRFVLANSGESKGQLVESYGLVMGMPENGWTHLGVEAPPPNEFGAITLLAGSHQEIVVSMQPKANEMISRNLDMHSRWPEKDVPKDVLYFRGALVYVDESGVKRRSAFCRPLEYSTLRFRRTDDPDYDYCD